MSRITIALSEEIASKMVGDKRKNLSLLISKKKAFATKTYRSKLPKNVLDFFENHENYACATHDFRVTGHGFNFDYIGIELSPTKDGGSPTINLLKKEGEKLYEMHTEIKDEKVKINLLERDIKNTLINLKTYKNVNEKFPEAAKFLPREVNYVPALKLDSIRDRLH